MITLPNQHYDIVGSIVLYKTDDEEVLRAVAQFERVPLRTHLCVIDNSPTASRLRFNSDRVSYYFAGANLGYGRAHNVALRAAKGHATYNLIMNTDVIYTPEAVEQLFDYLEVHSDTGLAAPKILYPDGSLQYVCRLLPTPANLFLRRFLPWSQAAKQADERYELRFWDHASNINLPYFQGSFLMVRTALANDIGGFDERFFMYGEDIDFCRRVYEASKAMYVADAKVVHEYRRYSNRSVRGTWIGIQNNGRYFNKWGWFFDRRRDEINRSVCAALSRPR